jgi:hypothetical protein
MHSDGPINVDRHCDVPVPRTGEAQRRTERRNLSGRMISGGEPPSRPTCGTSSIISCVVELKGGGAIETGMIGASQALDDKVSLNHVVTRLSAGHRLLHPTGLARSPTELQVFRGLLVKCNQFFLSQVQQTAVCNAVHSSCRRAPANAYSECMRLPDPTFC